MSGWQSMIHHQHQWWIEGWATGAAAQGTKGGGTKEGKAKITRICMMKNVIDFIILNNQMFRINDTDIYNINQYSVALH